MKINNVSNNDLSLRDPPREKEINSLAILIAALASGADALDEQAVYDHQIVREFRKQIQDLVDVTRDINGKINTLDSDLRDLVARLINLKDRLKIAKELDCKPDHHEHEDIGALEESINKAEKELDEKRKAISGYKNQLMQTSSDISILKSKFSIFAHTVVSTKLQQIEATINEGSVIETGYLKIIKN
jgi:predicted RNase H-like nuclease (RuvC/YqgF family)